MASSIHDQIILKQTAIWRVKYVKVSQITTISKDVLQGHKEGLLLPTTSSQLCKLLNLKKAKFYKHGFSKHYKLLLRQTIMHLLINDSRALFKKYLIPFISSIIWRINPSNFSKRKALNAFWVPKILNASNFHFPF